MASNSSHSKRPVLLISYCVFSALLLVSNQAIIRVYPCPTTVLLIQHVTSTLLGLGNCHLCCNRQPASKPAAARSNDAVPMVAQLLALLACMHGFKQGVTINNLVALGTSIPVAVAAAKEFVNGNAACRLTVHAVIIMSLSAVTSCMQAPAVRASTSYTSLLCMLSWFVGTTVHIIASCRIPSVTPLSSIKGVPDCRLLSSLVLLCIVLLWEPKAWLKLSLLSRQSGSLLALSCILAVACNMMCWTVQINDISVARYTAFSSCSQITSLIISSAVWSKHSSVWADLVTGAVMSISVLWQLRQPLVVTGTKGKQALQRPASNTASICVVATVIGGVVLACGALQAALVRKPAIAGEAAKWYAASRRYAYRQSDKAETVEAHLATADKNGLVTSLSSSNSIPGTVGSAAGVSAVLNTTNLEQLHAAASKPINIIVMTGLFWRLGSNTVINCSVDGIPLDCHITQDQAGVDTADALYYHVPSFTGRPRPKAFPNQLRLAMSLESAAYYKSLDDPNYMCGFDAEMTYRQCAQVVNWYSLEGFKNMFVNKPVPFEEREHALVYINSNCGAVSGRAEIMRRLIALNSSVPVHSLGRCDNNMPWPKGNPIKTEVQSRYKFCVAMENSVSPDYVTEKLWDGLVAGCVPVYMGAPSAVTMVPDRQGIIVYDPTGRGNASTPQELAQLLDAIGRDKNLYESMLRWKYNKPEQQPNPLFRYLWSVQNTTGECFLCQFLARHRANPRPRYTTCLFNATWAAANGRHVVNVSDSDGKCPPV